MSSPLRSPAAAPLDRSLIDEVLRGLRGSPKTLPAKLFYDDTGARLFERICTLEEYYLTRTELEILNQHATDIAGYAGPRCALIEYGSGAGVKIRLLLDTLANPAAYVPIDISSQQLGRVADSLASDYPGVRIQPLCADYTAPLSLPTLPHGARRLAFFPGSTIGNFHPTEAALFLQRVRRAVGPMGALVMGIDRRKRRETLHAAYNDAQGVTAAFNLNMLARLNREGGAHFDLSTFRHRAFFDPVASRIEMHLVSRRAQTVDVGGHLISFTRGESIWTESSYKYDHERLEQLALGGGFRIAKLWTDDAERFWVGFFEAL